MPYLKPVTASTLCGTRALHTCIAQKTEILLIAMYREPVAPSPTIRREDYCPPAFWIDSVDLTFDLDAAKTRVLNKMRVRRNPAVAAQALRLDGDGLTLARVLVNGQRTSFKMDGNALVLENLPEGEQPFDGVACPIDGPGLD